MSIAPISKTSAQNLRRPSPRHSARSPYLRELVKYTPHVAVCLSLPQLLSGPSPISVPTRVSARNKESTQSVAGWKSTEKRHRMIYESDGNSRKRAKTSGDTALEPISETMREYQPSAQVKQAPRVQSAIYAAHILSSSFNITHTINITLVGTWAYFWASVQTLKLFNRHFRSRHLDRSTRRHRISSHRHRRRSPTLPSASPDPPEVRQRKMGTLHGV